MTEKNGTGQADDTPQYGQVKWFNHTRGYGFLTNLDGGDDADIFVHHSELTTKDEVYKTLYQGEYVEYQEKTDKQGKRCATQVTGIRGHQLMCEVRNNSNNRSSVEEVAH